MRRWQTWAGIVSLFLFCGCGASIVIPIFASAKAAAKSSQAYFDAKRFSEALVRYTDSHGGLLPGKDWRAQIVRIDSSLAKVLRRRDGFWAFGYAAIPGTLGKKLEALPPETVLFVEYRWTDPVDVLQEVGTIGNALGTNRAFALTARSVLEGGTRPQSLARIGLLLGRQDANVE